MQQLGLFDTLRRPAVIAAVDRDGPVIQGEVDAVYRLPSHGISAGSNFTSMRTISGCGRRAGTQIRQAADTT